MEFTDSFGNLIMLDDDDMTASIFLRPKPSGNNYTIDELHESLRQAGVKHGIKEEILNGISQHGIYDRMILVAEGKYPEDGKDGEFEFLFNTHHDSTPKVLEDGSVDYLNVDLYERVAADQLVLRYHRATGGIMGYSVRGQIRMPQKGKDLPAIRGKGFHLSQDGLEYFSDMDGKIEFINGQIQISQVFEVKGDLDSTVGNIDFPGDVEIRGAVRTGMTVKAGGKISINGVVESADIEAKGDILLKSGVLGNGKCSIRSDKNIEGKFFESATVFAKGKVTCNYMMNSEVTGLEGVEVSGKKGRIVGGTTSSQNYVIATTIGNDAEILTNVKVGLDDEYLNRLKELRRRYQEVQSEIELLEKNLHVVSDQHEKIVLAFSMKVNERLEISKEIMSLEKMIDTAKEAYVDVKGTTYPKVIIRIDIAHTMLKYEIKGAVYKRADNLIVTTQRA
jgi:uncharacterized protein (DUF342 family)